MSDLQSMSKLLRQIFITACLPATLLAGALPVHAQFADYQDSDSSGYEDRGTNDDDWFYGYHDYDDWDADSFDNSAFGFDYDNEYFDAGDMDSDSVGFHDDFFGLIEKNPATDHEGVFNTDEAHNIFGDGGNRPRRDYGR